MIDVGVSIKFGLEVKDVILPCVKKLEFAVRKRGEQIALVGKRTEWKMKNNKIPQIFFLSQRIKVLHRRTMSYPLRNRMEIGVQPGSTQNLTFRKIYPSSLTNRAYDLWRNHGSEKQERWVKYNLKGWNYYLARLCKTVEATFFYVGSLGKLTPKVLPPSRLGTLGTVVRY